VNISEARSTPPDICNLEQSKIQKEFNKTVPPRYVFQTNLQ